MTTITPNVADQYIHKVMRLIHAPAAEKQRIQADLQAHLQEGLAEGEDMTALVERMGDPREVAAEFMAQVPRTYAGFWRRTAAFLIDVVLILVIAALFRALFALMSNYRFLHIRRLFGKILGNFSHCHRTYLANACIAMIMALFPPP